jgi:YHS domain-containing protein
VKGFATFSTTWKDATWHFSSPANLNAFIKDPERYAPQYGGYCAYGMAGGYKAPTEIDTWTIVNGKLYFNYNQKVKDTWSRDIPSYIQKADANWPTVKTKS